MCGSRKCVAVQTSGLGLPFQACKNSSVALSKARIETTIYLVARVAQLRPLRET